MQIADAIGFISVCRSALARKRVIETLRVDYSLLSLLC